MKIKTVIYDCEIINAIQSKEEDRVTGISYCDGWRDFENMGISVIGAYDHNDRFRVFCADNFNEFQALLDEADRIVDFNGHKFDRPLLKANGIEFDDTKHYDILREIWKAEGNDPDTFDKDTHMGYGLEACSIANGRSPKTGNGALAPIDWQQGRIGTVIDYCLNDVDLTRSLFRQIEMEGKISNPRFVEGETYSKEISFTAESRARN